MTILRYLCHKNFQAGWASATEEERGKGTWKGDREEKREDGLWPLAFGDEDVVFSALENM